MQSGAAAGLVAMKGAIWADPDSLDLLRLKVQADDIPPALDVVDATLLIEYSRTRIGDAKEQAIIRAFLDASGAPAR